MFTEDGVQPRVVQKVMQGIQHLADASTCLIVVTNEVFSDGAQMSEETRAYVESLGEINCRMAELADSITEVVYGIPVEVK